MRKLVSALLYTALLGVANQAMAEAPDIAALREGDMRKLVVHSEPIAGSDTPFMGEDGEEMTLADYEGQHVVLNFWATWCTPCRLEVPAFRRFAERHPEVHIVGVTADGLAQEIARVVEDLGITWTIAMPNPSVARLFKVDVYPTTVFIDPDGHVTAAHVGLLTDLQLAWLAW